MLSEQNSRDTMDIDAKVAQVSLEEGKASSIEASFYPQTSVVVISHVVPGQP